MVCHGLAPWVFGESSTSQAQNDDDVGAKKKAISLIFRLAGKGRGKGNLAGFLNLLWFSALRRIVDGFDSRIPLFPISAAIPEVEGKVLTGPMIAYTNT
jgi:hypothetical protein